MDRHKPSEAALLLILGPNDEGGAVESGSEGGECRRVVCRDESARQLLHDALVEVLVVAAESGLAAPAVEADVRVAGELGYYV